MKELTGPFAQLLGLEGLILKGAISDSALQITVDAGIITEGGYIVETGNFEILRRRNPGIEIREIFGPQVVMPGFTDAHTHLLFGGSRAADYALRIAGKSYIEIAAAGGGIWDTVLRTRDTADQLLLAGLGTRLKVQLQGGITTTEIKTGYGLNAAQELRMLDLISLAGVSSVQDLVTTCLAAHLRPRDFPGNAGSYLEYLVRELLPALPGRGCSRVDIFVEEGAFTLSEARAYLRAATALGFDCTVHADQFTRGGSELAVEMYARSADHLEASTPREIELLARARTAATVLPGASMGLGMKYAPARALLDAGASLVIASDWNPGSAPMGNLLMQASVLGAAEKLTAAEVYAALTFRAAAALGLSDRGKLATGMLADFQAFCASDHREILYHQGMLKPVTVWKRGVRHQL